MELAPAVAHRIIRSDILTGGRRLGHETIRLLPDAVLSEFEHELTDQLVRASLRTDQDTAEWEHIAILLARYTGPSVASQISAAYEDRIGNLPCGVQAPILAYFLNNDLATGLRLSRLLLSRRKSPGTQCHSSLFDQLLELRASRSALRLLAQEHLRDSDFGVQASAIKVISEIGSTDSARLLWQSLETGPELYDEHSELRIRRLAHGLIYARNWILTAPELARLREFCLAEVCEQEIERALEQRIHPRLTIRPFADQGRGIRILHYRNLSLEKALEKIDQLPIGTAINMPVCQALHFSIREDCRKLRGRAQQRRLVIGGVL